MNSAPDLEPGFELIEATAQSAVERLGREDQDSAPGVRRAFRIPVWDQEMLMVEIQGQTYAAFDVVEGGVGILSANATTFSLGQEVSSLELLFRGKPLALAGRVVHVTPIHAQQCLYGIQFNPMPPETEKKLHEYIEEARKEYFSHT